MENYTNDSTSSPTPVDHLRIYNLVVNVYINGILCVIGLTANTLILAVMHRLKTNSHSVLTAALACFDSGYLIFAFLYTVLRSVYLVTGHMATYYDKASPYLIAYVLPTGWAMQTGSAWTMTLIAVDRYIALSHPFKALAMCTVSNAKLAMTITLITAFVVNMPRYAYYYLMTQQQDIHLTLIAHVKIDLDGFDSDLYWYLYHISLTFIYLYIIPLISLTIFNILLISSLRDAQRHHEDISTNANNPEWQAKLALEVIVVVTKFIICTTPDFISGILGVIPGVARSDSFTIYNTFKEVLLLINFSINFFLYCKFNRHFKRWIVELISCKERTVSLNLSSDRSEGQRVKAISMSTIAVRWW